MKGRGNTRRDECTASVPLLRTPGRPLLLAVWIAAALVSSCRGGRDHLLAGLDASMARGDYRAAAIDARTLTQQEPANALFRIRYADALLPTGNYVEAANQLLEAQQLGAPPGDVGPRLLEALVGKRDFAGALALNLDPALTRQSKVMRLRAEALLGVGRNGEAQTILSQVIVLSPRDARAHLDMATVDARLADSGAVQSELDKAVELGSEDPLVQAAVGAWEAHAGHVPAAREHFAKAASLALASQNRATEAVALIGLADVALTAGDVAGAQQTVKRLEQVLPSGEPTLVLRARLAVRGGRDDEAEASLEKLLANNPRSAEGNFLLGAVKARQGYLDLAHEYLSAALAANPDDSQTRKLLAEVELRQGKTREVLRLIGAASASQDSDLLALGGRVSLSVGDTATAIGYFERRRELAASDTSSALELADAYLAAHRASEAVTLLRKTAVTGPLVNRREQLLITALAQSGQQSVAMAEAHDFAKSHPTDALALDAVGRGIWAAGDTAAARAMLLQATRVGPKERAAWNALGMLALSRGDTEEARRSFDAVLLLQPDDVDAILGKAEVALKSGQRDRAIRLLEAARHAQPAALGPRIGLARIYLAGNDRQHLPELLAELARIAPQSAEVRALEAQWSLAQRQIPEAISAFGALIVDFPAVAAFHAGLAQAYLMAGRLPEARRANLDALKLDPDYSAGEVFEASVALQENLLPEAAQAIAHLRSRPGASKALVATLQGDLEMRKGESSEAAQDYAASYAAMPSASAALREYAALRAIHSSSRQKPLQDWLARSPNDAAARLALGQDLQDSRNDDAAARQYVVLLQYHPDYVPALNNLAWLRVQAGAVAEGLALAKRAYERDSRSADVADTYGWSLLQLNKAPDALPILRAAHSMAPDRPDIRYHLAVALARSGLQPEAQGELEAIVGSHFPEQDAARKLLNSLTAPRSP